MQHVEINFLSKEKKTFSASSESIKNFFQINKRQIRKEKQ